MTPAGYSGTPLARKLGFKAGMKVWTSGMPGTVRAEIHSSEPKLTWAARAAPGLAAAHLFVMKRSELRTRLLSLRKAIAPDGMIWVSWPKKSSGVPSEITEDTVRELALPIGLVDVKVCAVDETWSGLKLVIRKELRS
ncbi:MAG: DUF3052 family protein [Gemmatimonadales bacterium]